MRINNRAAEKPELHQVEAGPGTRAVAVSHPRLGEIVFSCDGEVPLLFTENETNHERLFPGRQQNESRHVKDGLNDCVVDGKTDAVNPDRCGPKVGVALSRDRRVRRDDDRTRPAERAGHC